MNTPVRHAAHSLQTTSCACRTMAMPSNPTDTRVAANVRAEMGRRSISQSSLAQTLGFTQQSLSRRLTARTSFSVAELERIANILEVPLVALVGESRVIA